MNDENLIEKYSESILERVSINKHLKLTLMEFVTSKSVIPTSFLTTLIKSSLIPPLKDLLPL